MYLFFRTSSRKIMEFEIVYMSDDYDLWKVDEHKKIIVWPKQWEVKWSERGSWRYKVLLLKFTHELGQLKEKCFELVPSEKLPEVEITWQASPTASRPKKLYGPASLRNGVIIYPCDRFGCRIWCSCVLCRKKNENSLDEEIILDLNSHKVYHKALHPECDFCSELYSIFPALKLEKHHQIIFEHYTKKSSSRQKFEMSSL